MKWIVLCTASLLINLLGFYEQGKLGDWVAYLIIGATLIGIYFMKSKPAHEKKHKKSAYGTYNGNCIHTHKGITDNKSIA